jgi:hypothetical protein
MAAKRRSIHALAAAVPALAMVAMQLAHCGGQDLSPRDGGREGNAAAEGSAGDDATDDPSAPCGVPGSSCLVDGAAPTCVANSGWQCAVDTSCGSPTTLVGKVFDPAGLTPLSNVVVFVPNSAAQPPPISPGAPTCAPSLIGDYVNATETDATGSFVLRGVPVGSNVPVTVQVGKWRRTVAMSISTDCGTTHVPDGTLHLPGRRADGDMPQMALLTGGADNLACLLAGIGIDPSEFTAPGGGGRVAVYRGVGGADLSTGMAGDCTGGLCPLWRTTTALDAYDIVLLGCEGGENLQTKPASAIQAMHDWLTRGGKLFGVHYENTWFANGPADFQGVASWVNGPEAGAIGPFGIDSASSRGSSFEHWAVATGIAEADGGVPLVAQDVATSVSGVNHPTLPWIRDESTARVIDGSTFAGNVKAFTVGIPTGVGDSGSIPESGQCGKAVLSDIHPGGTTPHSPIPSTCAGMSLTPEEKLLEFLFFDDFAIVSPGCDLCPPSSPLPAGVGG